VDVDVLVEEEFAVGKSLGIVGSVVLTPACSGKLREHFPRLADALEGALTNYLVKDVGKDFLTQLILQIEGHAGTPGLLISDAQEQVEKELSRAVTISFP
jgi:hypothetical protein